MSFLTGSDPLGLTAMWDAIIRKRADVVKDLSAKGANLHHRNLISGYEVSPMELSALAGNLDVM